MAMFDFLKKREKAEEKRGIKEETQPLTPKEPANMLTELPEFPRMEEEEINPLPKLEPSSGLENSEINMPSLEESFIGKHVIHPEKNMAPEFGELKKEVEGQEIKKEIELPSELKEGVEGNISLPAKIKMPERRTFNQKKPVFVNVKSYYEISNHINVVTTLIEESEKVVTNLNSVKIRENNELKKLHDSLDGLNKKIIAVDNILSKG